MNRSVRRLSNGFTFIEMVISIAILLTLLAIGIWNYRHGLSERQLEGAFRQVEGLVRMAREQSLALGGDPGTDAVQVQFLNDVNGNLRVMVWKIVGGAVSVGSTPPPNATVIQQYESPPGISIGTDTGTFDMYYQPNGCLDSTQTNPSTLTFSSNSVPDVWKMSVNANTGIPTSTQ